MSDNKDRPNSADGRLSYDSTSTGGLVNFFNRNSSPYPVDVGGPKFDLIPIEKQKDRMLNVARMHAQQEYDRIVELVRVLESQAQQIKRRLEITDAVHGAEYQFQTYHGQVYWLVYEREKQKTILSKTGPNGWSSSAPESYEYIAAVKWLGDHTWQEVTDV
jgi:hypothetical protein